MTTRFTTPASLSEDKTNSYATIKTATIALAKLGAIPEGLVLNVVMSTNAEGRIVPILIWQGEDRVQACINSAHMGFKSFA